MEDTPSVSGQARSPAPSHSETHHHTHSRPSKSPEKRGPETSDGFDTSDVQDAKRIKVEPEVTDRTGASVSGAHQPPGTHSLRVSNSPHAPSPVHPSIRSPLPQSSQTIAHADDSERSPSATPTPSGTSTATTPERKPHKDRTSLHKAAVDKKRREKPRKRIDKDSKDKTRSKTPVDKDGVPVDDADDEAYCVCKGSNQDDDTFIGCDNCDGWFHPSCMGISEKSVESLDAYICPPCEAETGKTTVYKRICKREGCSKTARAASKYCSQKCAFLIAQDVLATLEKKEASALGATLAGYPSPTPVVIVETHSSATNGTPAASADVVSSATTLLATLKAQTEDVERLAELVAQRQALFAQAVELWDALKPVQVNEPAPAPKRKSKTKRRDGEAVVERPCGWDSRLLWSDEEVRAWDGKAPEEGDVDMSEEPDGGMNLLPTMCSAGRRCERHQGWQKTLGVALDVEAAQLVRKKDELSAIMERVTRWEEVEAAAAKAKDEVHKRLNKE